jgi:hypothetical protein
MKRPLNSYRRLLALIVIALLTGLTGCRPEQLAFDQQSGQAVSPLPSATPPTSPLPTAIVTSGPTPTPFPTGWPPDFTPSPTPTPTVTPEGAPVIITDPEGNFSLQLLPGWRAHVGGSTSIKNYDDESLSDVHTFPPGGLKIQMGVGKLPDGQSFEQWLSDWLTYRNIEEFPGPRPTSTEPIPYQLGNYQGVTFMRTGLDYTIMEIVLPLSDNRVMAISLVPADSPALAEALAMLSMLEISPELVP